MYRNILLNGIITIIFNTTHPKDMRDKFKFSPWEDIRIKNRAKSIGGYTAQALSASLRGCP